MFGIAKIFGGTLLVLLAAFALIRADSARAQTTLTVSPTVSNISLTGYTYSWTTTGTPPASLGGAGAWLIRMCYQDAGDTVAVRRTACGGNRNLANIEIAASGRSATFPTTAWFAHYHGGNPAGGGPTWAQGFMSGSERLQPSRRYAIEIVWLYYPNAGDTRTRHQWYGPVSTFTAPTTNRPAVSVSGITDTDATFTWTAGDLGTFPAFGWTLALRYSGRPDVIARWDNSGQDDATKFAQRTATAEGATAGVSFAAEPAYAGTALYPAWSGELLGGVAYTVQVEAYTTAYAGRTTLPSTPYLTSEEVAFTTQANAAGLFRPLYATATAAAIVGATATAAVADAEATETAEAGAPIETATAAAAATASALDEGNPRRIRITSRSGADVEIQWNEYLDPNRGSNPQYYGVWIREGHFTHSENLRELSLGPSRSRQLWGYRFLGAIQNHVYSLLLPDTSLWLGRDTCQPRHFDTLYFGDACVLPGNAAGPFDQTSPYTVYLEPYYLVEPYNTGRRRFRTAPVREKAYLSFWSGVGGVGPTPTPFSAIVTPTPRAYPTPTPTPQPRDDATANFVIPLRAGRVIDTADNAIAGVVYGRCSLPACIEQENDDRNVSFLSAQPPARFTVFALDSATLAATGTKTRIAQLDLRYTTPTETNFELDIPAPNLLVGGTSYNFRGREPIMTARGRAQAISFRYELPHDFPAGEQVFHARVFFEFLSGLPVYLTLDAIILRIECSGCEFARLNPTPTPLPLAAGLDMRQASIPKLPVGDNLRLTPPERPDEYRLPFMQPVANALDDAGISSGLVFGMVTIVIAVIAGAAVMGATKNLMLGAGVMLVFAAVATTPLVGAWSIGLVILTAIAFFVIVIWNQSHQV